MELQHGIAETDRVTPHGVVQASHVPAVRCHLLRCGSRPVHSRRTSLQQRHGKRPRRGTSQQRTPPVQSGHGLQQNGGTADLRGSERPEKLRSLYNQSGTYFYPDRLGVGAQRRARSAPGNQGLSRLKAKEKPFSPPPFSFDMCLYPTR